MIPMNPSKYNRTYFSLFDEEAENYRTRESNRYTWEGRSCKW